MHQDWEPGTTHRIGRQLQKSRKERKLSAQALADRTSELGYPIGRATISDIENRRRQSLSVAELLILAAALDISPVALLYGDQFADGQVEMLPGVQRTAAHAALWCTGEVQRSDDVGTAQEALTLIRLRNAHAATSPILLDMAAQLAPEQHAAQARLIAEQKQKYRDDLLAMGLIVADSDSDSEAAE